MNYKKTSLIFVVFIVSGCCNPVFEYVHATPEMKWIGKNNIDQDKVYEECKDRLKLTIKKLNEKYAQLLPSACRSQDSFSAFKTMPISVLKHEMANPKFIKDYVYDRLSSAKYDCLFIKNKEKIQSELDKSLIENLLSFSPYDYPSNLKYKSDIYNNTTDLLCYLDSECRELQTAYWDKMQSCVFDEFELDEYVVRVEKSCASRFSLGGGAGNNGKSWVVDYSKKPIKRSKSSW